MNAAMFQHFDVNSLSSFRRKFNAYSLEVATGTSNGAHNKNRAVSSRQWVTIMPPKDPLSTLSGYVGQVMVNDHKHGSGILLEHGQRAPIVYIGQFKEDKKNGVGIVITPRGEYYLGNFKDDIMYGPGWYYFPSPRTSASNQCLDSKVQEKIPSQSVQNVSEESTKSVASCLSLETSAEAEIPHQQNPSSGDGTKTSRRYRVCFRGMMNGRPSGRGCILWNDGSLEVGHFEGVSCIRLLTEKDIRGVQACVQSSAQSAHEHMKEILTEIRGRGLWNDVEVLLQYASVQDMLRMLQEMVVE